MTSWHSHHDTIVTPLLILGRDIDTVGIELHTILLVILINLFCCISAQFCFSFSLCKIRLDVSYLLLEKFQCLLLKEYA